LSMSYDLLMKTTVGMLISIVLYGIFDMKYGINIAVVFEVKAIAAFLMIFFVVFTVVLRAVRYSILTSSPLFFAIDIFSYHNLMNWLLPFRAGELLFPFMMAVKTGRSKTEEVGVLLLIRGVDLIIFSIFIFIFVFVTGVHYEYFYYGFMFFLMSIIVVCMLIFMYSIKMKRFVLNVLNSMHKIILFLSIKKIIIIVFSSVMVWASMLSVSYIAVMSFMDSDVLYNSFLGFIGSSITFVLPVSSVGNVGTFEASWMAFQLSNDVSGELALVTGVVVHVFYLATSLILSLLLLAVNYINYGKIIPKNVCNC
jgi:hypothetical protein